MQWWSMVTCSSLSLFRALPALAVVAVGSRPRLLSVCCEHWKIARPRRIVVDTAHCMSNEHALSVDERHVVGENDDDRVGRVIQLVVFDESESDRGYRAPKEWKGNRRTCGDIVWIGQM